MPRPAFSAEEAKAIAQEHFGVAVADVGSLPSYDDQNFRITAAGGAGCYVLKIAAAEAECRGYCDAEATKGMMEMENEAIRLMAGAGVSVPALATAGGSDIVVLEQLGAKATGPGTCFVRLISFLPGVIYAELKEHPPCLLRRIGVCLGLMDRALAGFEHRCAERDLTWDLANAPRCREHLSCVPEPERRALADRVLGRFEERVTPRLMSLPRQAVHGDVNDYNILVDTAALAEPSEGEQVGPEGVGVIDFGDMVLTARVCNLAVALAYVCMGKDEPLAIAAVVISAYQGVNALTEEEISLIWPMVGARNCQSALNAAHSSSLEPDNEYLLVSAAPAWALLEKAEAVSAEEATAALSKAAAEGAAAAAAAAAAAVGVKQCSG
jgi:Ser/Thr protein kinase RdoA (MazF antagonist)